MADGVEIPLESMQALSEALGDIMSEFDEKGAGARTGKLLDAIDRPLGDSRLARAADEFESAWDDKRETLRLDLEEMKKRIDDARDGWREADLELARSMEPKE
ncbi:hypothetical protein DY023_04195 [Microbacterium bovistercoris]|uniref:Flagellar protein FlgN n=1 Tax=Microbacterium bovistercoris TaxID=2293570 RepID=A0A371NW64_9MICO|nr:hypothetical protein [Microbacterium bovistercoris]REJ07204.1 hypothetical protein DY023_04195 [Microbacterium bovistercoris]